jgi:acetylglutamate kinase
MEKLIEKAEILIEAMPFLRKFRGKTFVIKYGGHAMASPAHKESFIKDVVLLKLAGMHPIIVHGGGPQIEEVLKQMGIESKYHNGLRITDAATMDVVEMVLVGKVNGDIVSSINKIGGNAVGFTGSDGNMIRAKKMAPQTSTDSNGKNETIDLGMVGEVTAVNPALLLRLLGEEDLFIPVISPVGYGEDGESLNINADTVASEIAIALRAEKLMLLTDVSGVKDKQGKLISEVKRSKVEDLIKDQTITAGMIPKVRGACDAIARGVHSVAIVDGRIPHAVLLEIFTREGVGTLIH